MITPRVYNVTQINRYIRQLFENDFILNSFWVKGEVSNLKYHTTGHIYFTLKDENSAINCVMFKGNACLLPFEVRNGMQITVCGYISTYEKIGQYQLYAELIEPIGTGSLNQAFEQLKEKLRNEGLFDEDFKREIKKIPNCIGIITSPTGAAVKDIIQVLKRRNRNVQIAVYPVFVQGEKAVDSIVTAIKSLNDWGKADTIILGRGGGSIEDLWAFNEEKVARAIFASKIPIISAVGHETDFTIADFVSDLRAPTPSAAAELAVTNIETMYQKWEDLVNRINYTINIIISRKTQRLELSLKRNILKRPLDKIYDKTIYIENLEKRLNRTLEQKTELNKSKFLAVITRLEALSPLSILKRGYGIIYSDENKVINSVLNVAIDDTIRIRIKDGAIVAKVEGKFDG